MRQAAAAWAADASLVVESEHEFANTGNYNLFYFRAANGCPLTVAPLGRAEEILPTLHANIDAQAWDASRLLLGQVEPMPKTALGVHIRRLLARIAQGHSPQAVMLIAPPACLSEKFLASLPEWPAP